MGTDRYEVFSEPCECGQGKYVVDECSPDHGYPTSSPFWYEGYVACKVCREHFTVEQEGRDMLLVENAAIEENRRRSHASMEAVKALRARSDVEELLKRFAAKLDTFPSKAAIWRYLGGLGFHVPSQSKFAREWAGGERWLARWISVKDIRRVLDALGADEPELRGEIARIEEIGQTVPLVVRKKLTTLGNP
jgi:hypothetical protein